MKIVADSSPSVDVEQVHPGGFFRTVQRGDRLPHLLTLAAQSRSLAIVANSDLEVEETSQRLRLSGVPIYEATDLSSGSVMEAFLENGSSTLVASHSYVVEHGPMPVTMVAHLRVAKSVRGYAKRLTALPAAVHLTFVIPEDHKRASSLRSHFHHDQGYGEPVVVPADSLIDLTESGPIASLVSQRRRFPLGR